MRWLLTQLQRTARRTVAVFLRKEDGRFILKEDGARLILE